MRDKKNWATIDEILYIKNIGKSIDLVSRKTTQKEALKGYIKGIKKRVKCDGDRLSIDISQCIYEAYLMLEKL
jgi:hypothetical protein